MDPMLAARSAVRIRSSPQCRCRVAAVSDPRETRPAIDRLARGLEPAQLELVLGELPVGVIIAEAPTGRLLYGNAEVERIWRHPFLQAAAVADYAGYRGFDRDGRQLEPHEWPIARSLSAGEEVRSELIHIERGDGTHGIISTDSLPIVGDDGQVAAAVVTFTDVTDREEARDGLELLAQTGRLLDSPLGLVEMLTQVAELFMPAMGDACGVYLLRDDGRIERHVSAVDPAVRDVLAASVTDLDLEGDYPIARVLRSGRPELIEDVPTETLRRVSRDLDAPAMVDLAPMSALILPMATPGRPMGAVSVFTVRRRRSFSATEQQAAAEVARRCGLALRQAELYARERDIATSLQAALLPAELPAIPGVELVSLFEPYQGDCAVGGDFYDAFATDDGWALVVGDVSGKGAPAAAVTALARNTLRAAALGDPAPGAVLTQLDRALRRYGDGHLCTAVYAHVRADGDGIAVELGVAGHPPPVVAGPDGARLLDVSGAMLGAFASADVGEVALRLGAGETLLLYTDGVTEARTAGGLLGERALLDAVAGATGAQDVVDRVRAALAPSAVGVRDDVALLAVSGRAGPAGAASCRPDRSGGGSPRRPPA
jgi:serine phosphatase RsbU (regulator of sigma subunit)